MRGVVSSEQRRRCAFPRLLAQGAACVVFSRKQPRERSKRNNSTKQGNEDGCPLRRGGRDGSQQAGKQLGGCVVDHMGG